MWKSLAYVITALACATSHPPDTLLKRSGAAADAKTLSPLWVGPAFSGTWYAPERSGEGFALQILDNGSAIALWFTYPPAGSAQQQAWMLAQDGRIEGDRVRFSNVYTTRGPRFGAGFDAGQLQLIPWGTIEFRFTGCNDGEVSYAGPAAWGSGAYLVTRLTAHAELECGGKRRLGAQGARSLEGLRQRGGLWFDPAHNGEGWVVEELPDGRAHMLWFTYDENGEQAWTSGVSATSGVRIDVTDNLRPVGTRFGADFDATRVVRRAWGRVEIDFDTCDRGVLRYTSPHAAFGSGTLRPIRLTRLAGAVCLDAMPAVPAGGTWSAGAAMPQPQSEMAYATLQGATYVAGGFGDPQGFKRYDPLSDSWTTLASLPGARHHALGVAWGFDHLYVAGGYVYDTGETASGGWRYIVPLDRWEPVAALPQVAASGAAALAGYAYFTDTSGAVHQYSRSTGLTRVIAGDARAPRDHSQLVAFQGELWLIGGRTAFFSDSPRVSIYDPASETWRAGPSLGVARAGFAAAASDTLLMVAGGELLAANPVRALASVEAIAAGGDAWSRLPSLPTPVHGVAGAIHGNAFHVLGGSTVAATASNTGAVQIYRWAP